MTNLENRIREYVDPRCLVTSKIKKQGCAISLAQFTDSRVIIDFDKPGYPLPSGATRADYLLVVTEQRTPNLVAAIELKKGRLHARQAIRQLQAAANEAERLIPNNESVRFHPIVACGPKSTHEINVLRKSKITFRKDEETVKCVSCGTRLIDILGSKPA